MTSFLKNILMNRSKATTLLSSLNSSSRWYCANAVQPENKNDINAVESIAQVINEYVFNDIVQIYLIKFL